MNINHKYSRSRRDGQAKNTIFYAALENRAAEQNLLGALLIDNDLIGELDVVIEPSYFIDEIHQNIFHFIREMESKSQRADWISLKGYFDDPQRAAGLPDGVGKYMEEMSDTVVSINSDSVRAYARSVRDAHLRRQVDAACTRAKEMCVSSDGFEDAGDLLLEVSEMFNQLDRSFASTDDTDIIDDILMNSIQRTCDRKEGKLSAGLGTGFASIDKAIGGLEKANLIILAARPAMGKTALAVNIACNVATTKQADGGVAPVLLFTMEMSKEEIGNRVLSYVSGVAGTLINSGQWSEEDLDRMIEERSAIKNAPLHICDRGGLTLSQASQIARRIKRTSGLGLIVIDYLQLFKTHASAYAGDRTQEIAEISGALKELAKRLEVPVIALSQLNRNVDARDDKRPVLSDLRQSGAIEQDADIVMFLHRQEYYLATTEVVRRPGESDDAFNKRHDDHKQALQDAQGKAQLTVAKHRNGETAVIDLAFDGRYYKFAEVDGCS